jgi:hypothetical protein
MGENPGPGSYQFDHATIAGTTMAHAKHALNTISSAGGMFLNQKSVDE